MSGDRDNSWWPLVGILAGLFVICLAAPHHWDWTSPEGVEGRGAAPRRPLAGPVTPRWDAVAAVKPELSPIPPLAQLPAPATPIGNPEPEEAASLQMPALAVPSEGSSQEEPARLEAAPLLIAEEPAELVPAVPELPVAQEVSEPVPAPRDTLDELAATTWVEPTGLLAYLDVLAEAATTRPWSETVRQQLAELRKALALHSDEAGEVLDRLAVLSIDTSDPAAADEEPVAVDMHRAQYALQRRVQLWKNIVALGGMDAVAGRHQEPDRAELAKCLAEVETMLRGIPGGEAWSRYLELGALHALTPPAADQSQAWLTAAEIIRRLTCVPLSPQQQQVAYSAPVVRLVTQLRYWASEPVSMRQFLETIERYEQTGLSSDGRQVVAHCIRLICSPVAAERTLGGQLEEHYRNANFRFSVTAELANRLVPKREPALETVDDRVLGTPVHGQSMTTTDVRFHFLPDSNRLRTALEIRGRVAAETSSYSGPATFFNSSWSNFLARKEIEVGLQGLAFGKAQVDVQNETRLRSVYTDFDPIPLVGTVAQEIARSQHDEKQPQVRAEMQQKVANRVKRQIDDEADTRLGKLSDRLKERLFGPLNEMMLGPTLVAAQTTEERMTMRLLLASPMQMGAHTPRPRALGGSLASVQIHESALKNMLEQLQLGGQSLTVAQLRERIAQRVHRPEMLEVTGENDDVEMCLAPENGVQVRCEDGQITITLSVVSLVAPSADEQWENFQVETTYRPQIEGRHAEFTREGTIRLTGDDLNMRSQIALRGIFSKTFSKQRPLVLTPESMMADPRFAGLSVTQIVLEDGWLSIAFGPEDPAGHALVARRPKGDE